jgi:hypothetical protein
MLKNAADRVLASLNASTYWKVRLGISLATALSGDALNILQLKVGEGITPRRHPYPSQFRVLL